MSTTATRWARRQYAGGAAAKCVLLLLADNHNERTGQCDPGTRTLADDAGSDQKTIRGWLDQLRDAGLISWTGSARERRNYTLHMDRARGRDDAVARVVGAEFLHTAEGHSPSASEGDHPADDEAAICGAQPLRGEGHSPSELRGTAPLNHQEPPENHQKAAARARARRPDRHTGQQRLRHLANTARSVQADQIVRTWLEQRPAGITGTERIAAAKAVDELLADDADPAHMVAALELAFDGRAWRMPGPKRLEHSYARARDRAAAETRPVQPPLAAPVSTGDRRIVEAADAFDRVFAARAAAAAQSTHHAQHTLPTGDEVIDAEIVGETA